MALELAQASGLVGGSACGASVRGSSNRGLAARGAGLRHAFSSITARRPSDVMDEQVQHAAVGGGKCRDLGIDVGGVEPGIEDRDVATELAFEPAFGSHAVERVAFVAGGGAALAEAGDEVTQARFGLRRERGFAGSGAEGDLLGAVEGLCGCADADAGELQAVEEEGELGTAADALLRRSPAEARRNGGPDAGCAFGEAILRGGRRSGRGRGAW